MMTLRQIRALAPAAAIVGMAAAQTLIATSVRSPAVPDSQAAGILADHFLLRLRTDGNLVVRPARRGLMLSFPGTTRYRGRHRRGR
jgi:hypothetical protein